MVQGEIHVIIEEHQLLLDRIAAIKKEICDTENILTGERGQAEVEKEQAMLATEEDAENLSQDWHGSETKRRRLR